MFPDAPPTNSTLLHLAPVRLHAPGDTSTFQVLGASRPRWEAGFVNQANWLLSAQPSFQRNLLLAYQFLKSYAPHQLIAPAISWGPDDDIQIEWHGRGVDLEIEFMTGELAELYTWFHEEGCSTMDELAYNLDRARRAMRLLVETHEP